MKKMWMMRDRKNPLYPSAEERRRKSLRWGAIVLMCSGLSCSLGAWGRGSDNMTVNVSVTFQAPADCSLNNKAIEVDFGTLDISSLNLSSAKPIDYTITCTGSPTLSLKLDDSEPKSTFKSAAMGGVKVNGTVAPALGILFSRDSQNFNYGDDIFTKVAYKAGYKFPALTAQLIKDPTASASSLPTGNLTASTKLILSYQ
jgi:type 1 fimbria pilin